MKTIIYILSIVFILAGCHSSKKKIPVLNCEKTDLEEAQLYGKLKQLHLKVYMVKDTLEELNPSSGMMISQEIRNYSPDGYLKSKIQINNKLDTIIKEEYIYESGHLVSILKNISDSLKYGKTMLKYSPAGFKEEEITYYKDSILEHKRYKTNNYGFISEKQVDQGHYVLTYQYEYDATGLMIKEKEIDPEGRLYKQTEIQYNDYGMEVNKRVSNSVGRLLYYYYSEYDKDTLIVKKIYEDVIYGIKEQYFYLDPDKVGNWKKMIYRKNQMPYLTIKRCLTYYY